MIVTSWGHDHGEVGPGWVLGSSWNRSSQFEVDHRESKKQKAWETGREKLRQKNQVGYRSICFWGGWRVVRVSFSCFSCLAFLFFFFFLLNSREQREWKQRNLNYLQRKVRNTSSRRRRVFYDGLDWFILGFVRLGSWYILGN